MSSSTPQKQDSHALWTQTRLDWVEDALSAWVAPDAPLTLSAPMRYAVLDGGKRLRPLLVFAAAEAVGVDFSTLQHTQHADAASLRAACAVELIHAYSLVHDDMPCMDNDVLRRGKPTVHIKYGQAQALLAGDALQALAFELLTPDETLIPARTQATLCRLLANAAGCQGMAGGQAIDLESVGQQLGLEALQQMHRLKTGALLQTSVLMGAACGQTHPEALAALAEYGAALGLAFQVVDDVLDVIADSSTLGKTVGKDADNNKPTFVSLLGLQASQAYAQTLLEQALLALQNTGLTNTQALRELADKVVNRGM